MNGAQNQDCITNRTGLANIEGGFGPCPSSSFLSAGPNSIAQDGVALLRRLRLVNHVQLANGIRPAK